MSHASAASSAVHAHPNGDRRAASGKLAVSCSSGAWQLCRVLVGCFAWPSGYSHDLKRQRDQELRDWEAATIDPDLQAFRDLQSSVQERCRIRKDFAGNILCDNMLYWSENRSVFLESAGHGHAAAGRGRAQDGGSVGGQRSAAAPPPSVEHEAIGGAEFGSGGAAGSSGADPERGRDFPGGSTLPPIVALAPCAHVFCKPCLTNWINVCDEREMEAVCLIENCREPIKFAVKIDEELLQKKLKEDHVRAEREREERNMICSECRGNPVVRPPPTWISGRVVHSQM